MKALQKHLSKAGKAGMATLIANTTPEERREWASRGGKARAEKYTPEQLKAWARNAGLAKRRRRRKPKKVLDRQPR